MTWYFVVAVVVGLVLAAWSFKLMRPTDDNAGDYAVTVVVAPALLGLCWPITVPLAALALLGHGLHRLHKRIING